uniref:Uncharacterized protein n=1 Tax=Thiomonas intermedia (strain K12) TaxID=75379 RepID=D5WYT8_THIK1
MALLSELLTHKEYEKFCNSDVLILNATRHIYYPLLALISS